MNDFMDLNAAHCDDNFNHFQCASNLHSAQLHHAQGATFSFSDRTMALFPAVDPELRLGVTWEDRSDTTMDVEVQVDLELRLGVCAAGP